MSNPLVVQVAPRFVIAAKRADFPGMGRDIDVVQGQSADEDANLTNRVRDGWFVRPACENLELLQAQPEQARGQGLGNCPGAAVLVDLKIIEIIPVIDDEEVGLLLAANRICRGAGSAAKHLPELHL